MACGETTAGEQPNADTRHRRKPTTRDRNRPGGIGCDVNRCAHAFKWLQQSIVIWREVTPRNAKPNVTAGKDISSTWHILGPKRGGVQDDGEERDWRWGLAYFVRH